MLEYFRKVEQTGEEILVTSHGKPSLRVVPIAPKASVDTAFRDLQGKVHIDDTVLEPETEEWDL